MYNEDKINDSLEFVEQIKMYDTIDPVNVSKKYNDGYVDNESITHQKKMKRDINSIAPDDYTEKSESTFKVIAGDVLYVVVCVLISIVIALLTTKYIAHHTIVDGNSMNDTLYDKDCLILSKLSYMIHKPERFDIVVFEYSENVNYIKRVIGLPGEVVQIIDGYVYINGQKLTDDVYGKEIITNPGVASEPVIVGENQYFVLGDNRNSSSDSRKTDVGLIDFSKIDGKVVFRLYPFDMIEVID